ncbi:MAG: M28 family peptidase, partial [Nitrospiria bacterium]
MQKDLRVSPELIWGHIHQLVGTRHADTNPSGLEKALGYLAETYTHYGLQIREEVFNPFGVKYPNLIGVLPGKEQADEVLIIGAHYDTVAISPGADDNASGLAVMLETARVLSGLSPGWGIEFVGFSMEEQGLLGSHSYANRARRSGKKILGAIVLECVG